MQSKLPSGIWTFEEKGKSMFYLKHSWGNGTFGEKEYYLNGDTPGESHIKDGPVWIRSRLMFRIRPDDCSFLDPDPDLKPLWPFGRINNTNKAAENSPGFENYVANLEKSFNTLIKFVNNEHTLKYMAGDLGSRHFYYGVTESHVDLFGNALVWALWNINRTNGNAFDQEMETVWKKLFDIVKVAMQAGIAKQRLHYLKNSISFHNYSILIGHWDK
uniref:Globin family profile domain-containing protein n=1 Tax=Romanomermis culicivorax TaxID=13658 RepID=A0A915JNY9_ROMCU